jgi:hypothetical protein
LDAISHIALTISLYLPRLLPPAVAQLGLVDMAVDLSMGKSSPAAIFSGSL